MSSSSSREFTWSDFLCIWSVRAPRSALNRIRTEKQEREESTYLSVCQRPIQLLGLPSVKFFLGLLLVLLLVECLLEGTRGGAESRVGSGSVREPMLERAGLGGLLLRLCLGLGSSILRTGSDHKATQVNHATHLDRSDIFLEHSHLHLMRIFVVDDLGLLLSVLVPERFVVLSKGLDLGFRRLNGFLTLRILRGLGLDVPASLR